MKNTPSFGPGQAISITISFRGALSAVLFWAALSCQANAHPYTGMVSFGDSLSDVGNTLGLLSENAARAATGYNSNFYFPNRFSNGYLWIDHLSANLGFGALGTLPRNNGIDVKSGTNFAWAAARSGTGQSFGLIPNLQEQIGFYTQQLTASNPALPDPASTLFALWIGGNDVFARVEDNDPITPAQVAANVSAAITNLYNAGGRSFLIPNLPPIGQSPDYLNDPIKGPLAASFTSDLNFQLDLSLNALSGSLGAIDIIKLDINQIFGDVTANPSAYGLSNVTQRAYTPFSGEEPLPFPYGSAVANPSEYLYWDSAHGTTAVNVLIANAAYQAVVPEPCTVVLLLGGAIAIFAIARNRHQKPNQIPL